MFFATVDTFENESVMTTEYNGILCSYFYFQDKFLTLDLGKLMKKSVDNPAFEIFMDSGAFSAKAQNQEIALGEYSRYLLRLKPHCYAGLDVIGNAEKTLKNQEKMEKEYGLNPIPTFHMEEDVKYLYPMIDKYDYIALGGMVFSKNTKQWLDEVWSIILRKKPTLKVHGFGMSDQSLIMRYPWYSVDSSSFKSGKRFGRMILWDELKKKLFTVKQDDFMTEYLERTKDTKILNNSKRLYRLTDTTSVKAFGDFIKYVSEIHKHKDFSYLICQGKLF